VSCGRSHSLEALVAGEATLTLEAELRAHIKSCSRCRHELNWLETEQALIRQRAGRDEVAHLWRGVARRSGITVSRAWPGVLATLAAGATFLLLLVGLWQAPGASLPQGPLTLASTPMGSESSASASAAGLPGLESSESTPPVCSILPQGLGFHCSPELLASFVASR
jgi:anti-sigma factor RsiW